MKSVKTHEADNGVFYCHAEDEVKDFYDFREWIEDNDYCGLVVKGQDHLVYSPRLVREYIRTIEKRDCKDLVEDYGQGEIIRQARGLSNLEIMD